MRRSTRTELLRVVLLTLLGLWSCSDDDNGDGATAGTGSGAGSNGNQAGRAATGGAAGRDAGGTSGPDASAMAGDSGSSRGMAGRSGAGSEAGASGRSAAGSMASAAGASGSSGAAPSFDDVKGWIEDYMTAHPGQDGDINNKTPAQLAADPDAQRLASLCGEDQRPVIPALVWEYGGSSHAWINYEASALVYCVYLPVSPSTDNWDYDAAEDHVTADVYVLFPDENPCKAEAGADQVAKCIGDPTNFEILVDTASLNDGSDAGLSLSEASTELRLVLPDGNTVHLWDDA